MTGRPIARKDFVAGICAVIVDKDTAPRWNPATPDGVTDELLNRIIAPLPAAEV